MFALSWTWAAARNGHLPGAIVVHGIAATAALVQRIAIASEITNGTDGSATDLTDIGDISGATAITVGSSKAAERVGITDPTTAPNRDHSGTAAATGRAPASVAIMADKATAVIEGADRRTAGAAVVGPGSTTSDRAPDGFFRTSGAKEENDATNGGIGRSPVAPGHTCSKRADATPRSAHFILGQFRS